jgi:FO synthase
MNESITRAAGATFGQELPPGEMQRLIADLDRVPCQRTTLYAEAPVERVASAMRATPLEDVVNPPPRRRARSGERQLVRFGQG